MLLNLSAPRFSRDSFCHSFGNVFFSNCRLIVYSCIQKVLLSQSRFFAQNSLMIYPLTRFPTIPNLLTWRLLPMTSIGIVLLWRNLSTITISAQAAAASTPYLYFKNGSYGADPCLIKRESGANTG